ncbi:hypothetical protein KY289_011205 [Solanum tuberosum]|nr:hypothetical protein KY289_011205 [Solanum tuberosum]
MQSVHGRQERKLVVLNRYNQPIGPTNAVVTELGSFLGTLARNAMFCPLNIHNWKNMDTKKDLWDYTQEKEKESPDELSTKELFVATRSRKPGRVYKDSNEDTISKIAEMEKMQSQQNEDDNQSFDAFTTVMGHEHPGCLRLYGRGVTKMGAQSPQEAMQPLNRPSSSKNHQGGEDNKGDDESSDEDLIT